MKELTPTAKVAAEIRAELTAAGIKASVKTHNYAGGSRIDVQVASGSLTKAKEIAEKREVVRRDQGTGEILLGGNRFIDVKASETWLRAVAERFKPAVHNASGKIWEGCRTLEPVEGTPFSVGKTTSGENGWMVWKPSPAGGLVPATSWGGNLESLPRDVAYLLISEGIVS